MNTATSLWLGMRVFRWLAWIAFLLFALHYIYWPQNHLNQFGHLLPRSEIVMFGLSLLAVFAGMFELALRGRAGLATPKPFHLKAAKATGPIASSR
jgi:hypothetical protein